MGDRPLRTIAPGHVRCSGSAPRPARGWTRVRPRAASKLPDVTADCPRPGRRSTRRGRAPENAEPDASPSRRALMTRRMVATHPEVCVLTRSGISPAPSLRRVLPPRVRCRAAARRSRARASPPVALRMWSSRCGVTSRPRMPRCCTRLERLGQGPLVDRSRAARPPPAPGSPPARRCRCRARSGVRIAAASCCDVVEALVHAAARSAAARTRGTRRSASRRPARRASRAVRPCAAGRGSPWRPRTPPPPGCARARSGRRSTSSVSSAPRCTPPMPPVANTPMPACCAASIVAATVVEPVPPAEERGGEVAEVDLGHAGRGGQPVELVAREPDAHVAVEDADRGRYRARAGHARLHLARHAHAVRAREPVRDHRRLERDDAAMRGERTRDLWGDAHPFQRQCLASVQVHSFRRCRRSLGSQPLVSEELACSCVPRRQARRRRIAIGAEEPVGPPRLDRELRRDRARGGALQLGPAPASVAVTKPAMNASPAPVGSCTGVPAARQACAALRSRASYIVPPAGPRFQSDDGAAGQLASRPSAGGVLHGCGPAASRRRSAGTASTSESSARQSSSVASVSGRCGSSEMRAGASGRSQPRIASTSVALDCDRHRRQVERARRAPRGRHVRRAPATPPRARAAEPVDDAPGRALRRAATCARRRGPAACTPSSATPRDAQRVERGAGIVVAAQAHAARAHAPQRRGERGVEHRAARLRPCACGRRGTRRRPRAGCRAGRGRGRAVTAARPMPRSRARAQRRERRRHGAHAQPGRAGSTRAPSCFTDEPTMKPSAAA